MCAEINVCGESNFDGAKIIGEDIANKFVSMVLNIIWN